MPQLVELSEKNIRKHHSEQLERGNVIIIEVNFKKIEEFEHFALPYGLIFNSCTHLGLFWEDKK